METSISSVTTLQLCSSAGVGGGGSAGGGLVLSEPASCTAKTLYESVQRESAGTPSQAGWTTCRRVGFYRLRGQLGAGNFSKVRFGVHLLTNECVAVKVIDKTSLSESARHFLSQEISCMRRLNHPNLIHLFEVIESYSTLHLVMECASQGTLQSRVISDGPFEEGQARQVFAQIAAGLHHMHKNDFVHRDVKAENIFLTDRTVKLGDFGFSVQSHASHRLDTFCGSIPYAAPELFEEDSYFGRPVDVWAAGVTLYFMLSRKMPFTGTGIAELQVSIVKGDFASLEGVTPICEEFVRRLLHTDAGSRFTIQEILSTEWIQGERSTMNADVQSKLCWCEPMNSITSDEDLERVSPDPEILQRLVEIGLPLEGVTDFSAEPRNPTLGTYRVLVHRKQSDIRKEWLDRTGSNSTVNFSLDCKAQSGSYTRRFKAKKSKKSRLQRPSKLCTIL